MASPLRGIKVLELGQFIAGPFTGLLLADLGAEVIKVEPPDRGDPFREFGISRNGAHGYSHNFCAFNRNKLSLTVDLNDPRGQAVFHRMVRQADVVIENFRPDIIERLRIDYDTLSEANPRLVYCSISGFSADGPYRDRPSYDAVAQAYSGLMSLSVEQDDPRIRGVTLSDQVTSMQACSAIIAALYDRERTGTGSHVDVSMVEASIGFIPDAFTAYTESGVVMSPQTRVGASLGLVFDCADRKMVAIQVSSKEKFWRGLLAAIERPDIGDDPRFHDRPSRINNFAELLDVLRPIFAARPRSYWIERLALCDVPFGPVYSMPEVMEDPEVRRLGMFHQLDHPRFGKLTAQRRAVRIDGQREVDPLPPPALGEHTDDVLGQLGFAADEISELRKSGIVGGGERSSSPSKPLPA